MLVASFTLVVAGLAIYRVGVKSADGTLPPQTTMGLRTRTTLSSDEAWYAAQRASADLVKASGVLSVIGGLVSIPVYDQDALAATIVLGTALLLLIIAGWAAVRGQAAAKEVIEEARP
ncbi:MAG: SdpI family protein [Acidimicrobiia bacterium]|nr:SdpI family protein [Acidimicrobiia bacterium]